MAALRPLIRLSLEEMDCIQPGKPVNELVISAFLRVIERRSIFYPTLPSVWACDTLFLPQWRQGGFPTSERRTMGIDILNRELLFFPLHLPEVGPGGHWALIAVDLEKKEIQAYDSLGFSRTPEVEAVHQFIRALSEKTGNTRFQGGWKTTETLVGCPRQEDEVSCGVFVCAFADKLSRRSRLRGIRIDATKARKTVSSVLRRGRFDNEDFSTLETTPSSRNASGNQTPAVVLDVTTPDGTYEVELQDDPLMQELNCAISRLHTGRVGFPPLVRTPRAEAVVELPEELLTTEPGLPSFGEPEGEEGKPSATPMETDQSKTTEEPTPALGGALDGPSDKHRSPCLSIDTSDVEEQPQRRPTTSLPSPTPMPVGRTPGTNHDPMRVPLKARRGISLRKQKPSATGKPPAKTVLQPDLRMTVRRGGDSRRVRFSGASTTRRGPTTSVATVTRPGTSSESTVARPRYLVTVRQDANRQVSSYIPRGRVHQPWVPPKLIRKAQQNCPQDMTARQKKNRRWRVYLSDGTYVRVRPHQLKDLPTRH